LVRVQLLALTAIVTIYYQISLIRLKLLFCNQTTMVRIRYLAS
jgi:hypothetical protein